MKRDNYWEGVLTGAMWVLALWGVVWAISLVSRGIR